MSDSNKEFNNSSAVEVGQKYVEKTIHYYKLKLLKSITEDISSFIKIVLIGLLSTLILIFLSISLAIYLGDLLANSALGYLLVSSIYILILLILIAVKKKIEKRVLLKMNKYFN